MGKLLLKDIVLDKKFMLREKLNNNKVGEYRQLLDSLPPVLVANIDGHKKLIDGWHRFEAAQKDGREGIEVIVRKMTEDEAYEAAVKANSIHGIPLKTKEKRKIAEEMLIRFTERSDQWISEDVGLSKTTVAAIRNELESGCQIDTLDYRIGKDGKKYPIKPPDPPEPPDPSDHFTIYQHDSRLMGELGLSDVHLVITSPPYNVGIPYDSHDDARDDYLRFLLTVWKECYKVMVDGARIAVVVPFGIGRNPWVPFASRVMDALVNAGFEIRGQIIWDKGTSGGRTTWGSYRLPTDPSLRDTSECVIVAHKKQSKLEIPDELKMTDTEGSYTELLQNGDLFRNLTQDHWSISPERVVDHPAPFPVSLPEKLIRLYAYPGAHILDPFAGSGSTGVAAIRLGCYSSLIEIDEGYCGLAKERCDEELSKSSK